MLIQTSVGQPTTQSTGTNPTMRGGQLGEAIVQELHGRYYETAYRKNLFYSYVTAQTLTAANTTYTGHVIYNPSTTVNLVIQKISIIVSVTSASMTGISLGISTGQTAAPTGTTAATQVGNCFIGGAAAQGQAYKAATLANAGTPVMALMHNTAAINTVGVDAIVWDLEGSFIIPASCTAHLLALGAASAASAVTSSIMWEEVPV